MRYRSKTMATWLAVGLGTLGAHRFYLKGRHDLLAWLHPLPTLAGLAGVVRMQNLGQDDAWASLLSPLLGVMISVAMLSAIVYGLTPDDRWQARHNPGQPARATGWGPVLGVILALMLGGGVLMGTIAYSIQHFFEWQLQAAVHVDRRAGVQLSS
jgi:hypothetical protein